METLAQYFLWFIIYCFIGWIYESTVCSIQHRRFVNRGFLNGPLIPIYGTGAVLAIFLFSDYAGLNPVYLFLLCGFVDCVLEYLTSWAMEKLFHARWWDYSNMRFQINGRVCLLGFCAFGALSVVLLRWLHPAIAAQTEKIPLFWLYLLDSVLAVLVLVDTALTVHSVLAFSKKLEEIQHAIDAEREKAAARFSEYREEFEQRLEVLGDQVDRIQEKIRDSRHVVDIDTYRQMMEERIAALRERLKAGGAGEESRLEQLQQLFEEKRAQLQELSKQQKELLDRWAEKAAQREHGPVKRLHRALVRQQRYTQRRLLRAFPHLLPNRHREAFWSLRRGWEKTKDSSFFSQRAFTEEQVQHQMEEHQDL